MIKRFVSFFTALSMTFMFFGTLNMSAEDVHIHKACADSSHADCTHSEIEYEPFPSSPIAIDSDKNYYLTGDLDNDALKKDYIYIQNATVNFCLNGYSIDTKGFKINNNGVLNICDCKTGGCMKNTLYTGGVVLAENGGTLNVYSGKLYAENGRTIYDNENGIVNIYGGEMSSANGDSISVGNESALSIYGGTITAMGNYSNGISTVNNNVININGGTITGGECGIMINYANNVVNINGGTVTGTESNGVYVYEKNTANIKNGTVASINNAAVYAVDGGIVNISGGSVEASKFPTVWVNDESTANISGGRISNTNYSSYIWNNGTLNISGGTFSKSSERGYIKNYGNLRLAGSPVLENTSIWLCSDDNIAINGALTYTDPYAVYVDGDLPRTLTNGWDMHMPDKNTSKYFKSPYSDASIKVVYRNNEAVMAYYYNITYDANGGICELQTVRTDASDKLASLAVPTRDGYSFDGWFTEENGGEQITTDTVFDNDTTIYAHWTCSDHVWRDTYEKDEDQHWKICTRCNAESEKSGHTWNEGTVTTPPTETAEGVTTYKCTVCDAEKTEPIEMLGHTHTFSEAWTSDDIYHWHEATCGHDDEISGKAPHTFVDGKCTICQKTDPSYTQPTEPTETEPTGTEPSDTEPPVTEPSDTEPTVTQPPVTEPPITEPTVTAPSYIPSFPSGNTPAPSIPVLREPYLQNEAGKIGWAVISDDIWATSDGEAVLVNMNGTTELPKNIVSDISGRDIDLVLIMNGGFIWTINGMSVDKAKTVDMRVRKLSVIPRSTVQEFFGDSKTVQIDLRHNGDFGFTAELTINLGDRYSGKYANSYCYKSRKFEIGDSAEIVDGQAKLRFTHASSWLIKIGDFPDLEDVSSAAGCTLPGRYLTRKTQKIDRQNEKTNTEMK